MRLEKKPPYQLRKICFARDWIANPNEQIATGWPIGHRRLRARPGKKAPINEARPFAGVLLYSYIRYVKAEGWLRVYGPSALFESPH